MYCYIYCIDPNELCELVDGYLKMIELEYDINVPNTLKFVIQKYMGYLITHKKTKLNMIYKRTALGGSVIMKEINNNQNNINNINNINKNKNKNGKDNSNIIIKPYLFLFGGYSGDDLYNDSYLISLDSI